MYLTLNLVQGVLCRKIRQQDTEVMKMRIHEVAEMTGLSDSNIRFYEKKGLLAPARDTESRYRDYSMKDVEQLKRIILYRKMNVPIETIYLLENQEISLENVLKRQEEALTAQQEMLQGSLDLCRKLLEEENFEELDVDYYLNYVKEEEQKGKHFAELEELLEDFTAFSGLNAILWDPRLGALGRWLRDVREVRALALLVLIVCIATPVAEIVQIVTRNDNAKIGFLAFWVLWLLSFLYAFFRFRKRK